MGSIDKNTERFIEQNAANFVKESRRISGIDFGYNEESVIWSIDYINRIRRQGDISQENLNNLMLALGSYLGEYIIRVYGGRWENKDGGLWSVYFFRRLWRVSFRHVVL